MGETMKALERLATNATARRMRFRFETETMILERLTAAVMQGVVVMRIKLLQWSNEQNVEVERENERANKNKKKLSTRGIAQRTCTWSTPIGGGS